MVLGVYCCDKPVRRTTAAALWGLSIGIVQPDEVCLWRRNKRLSWKFEYDSLANDIPHIVRAMDNIIDRAIYPLPEQRDSAMSKRRMGLA